MCKYSADITAVTREVEDYLDVVTDNIDGMSRQVILSFFRCLQPEMRAVRRKNLPPLEFIGVDDMFDTVLKSLPPKIEQALKAFAIKAKFLFSSYNNAS